MSRRFGKFERSVNDVVIEQRFTDGFINATAMAVAHGKDVYQWLRTKDASEFFEEVALDLGMHFNSADLRNSGRVGLSAKKVAEIFPGLIMTKPGSPENGGGTWFHPDVAVYFAQWCSKRFAIQVSRWVREWMMTGQNPISPTLDQQWSMWQQRYDIRVDLKDRLRPALMLLTAEWAARNGKSPQTVCSDVHDAMNERIQGIKSKTIKGKTGLSMADLIRDYFGTEPLAVYSAINTLAINHIKDRSIEPLQAVHQACDDYLSLSYLPKPVPIIENVYSQGLRLKRARRQKRLQAGIQMSLFDVSSQAS